MVTKIQKVLEAFRDYVSLKVHFNSDIVWSEGLANSHTLSEEALIKRKDYRFFDELAREYPERQDRRQFLISCFVAKPDTWVGDVFEHDYKDFHRRRMIRVGALQHNFESEVDNILDYLLEHQTGIRQLLLTSGSAPVIIAKRLDIIGGVSDETLALLDKAFGFTRGETTDPLWKLQKTILHKYSYFLNIDRKFMIKHLDRLVQQSAKCP